MEETTPQLARPTNPKVVYWAAAAILIGLLGYATWGFLGGKASSSTILQASELTISKNQLIADGEDTSIVNLTITNQGDGSPAEGVWIGLNIKDPALASEEFSYFGWYSAEPGRSFYQTNGAGQVVFRIKSKLPGDITYGVYAANPDQRSSGKYESLEKEFTLHFQ